MLMICDKAEDCIYQCHHRKPHKKNSECDMHCEDGPSSEGCIFANEEAHKWSYYLNEVL